MIINCNQGNDLDYAVTALVQDPTTGEYVIRRFINDFDDLDNFIRRNMIDRNIPIDNLHFFIDGVRIEFEDVVNYLVGGE